MKNLRHLFILCGLILFSCSEKDPVEDPENNNSGKTVLTLKQSELYQLNVGHIETTDTLMPIDYQVRIGNTPLSANIPDKKNLYFIVGEDIPAGNHKLLVKVNGQEEQEFNLEVKALPEVTNPDEVKNDYLDLVDELESSSTQLFDSMKVWYGVNSHAPLVEAGNRNQDSLNKYIAEFNNLSGPEKLTAARIIQANLNEMRPVLESIKELNQAMLENGRFGKAGSVCDDNSYNHSQVMECNLNESKRQIQILKAKLVINTAIGIAAGGALGSITANPTFGWWVGVSTAAYLNIESIKSLLETLYPNFYNKALVTTHSLFRKNDLIFVNNEANSLSYSLTRRNMTANDQNGSIGFVSDFISTYIEFTDWVKENISSLSGAIPSLPGQTTRNTPLEDLNYLTFSVEGNSKVSLENIGGSNNNPRLTLRTDETTNQPFNLRVSYDDGVFQVSTLHSSILEVDESGGGDDPVDTLRWYVGKIELVQSNLTDCNEHLGQYFTFYAAIKGDHNAVNAGDAIVYYLESPFDSNATMYSKTSLTDDGQGNFVFNIIPTGSFDFTMQAPNIIVTNSIIKARGTGALAGRIFQETTTGETPCGSNYLFYYWLDYDIGFAGTDVSGVIPPAVAAEINTRIK